MEKRIIKNTLFIYYFFTLISCHSIKRSAGVYKNYDKETRSSRSIILNSDHTFEYKRSAGLISSSSKGYWSLNNDSLAIKSNGIYKNGFIELEIDNTPVKKDSIWIKVISKEYQLPVSAALISLDSSSIYLETNEVGIVKVNSNGFYQIKIAYLGKDYFFISKNKIRGNVNVFLFEEDLSKTYFDNDIWIKKGNKIISPDEIVFKLEK